MNNINYSSYKKIAALKVSEYTAMLSAFSAHLSRWMYDSRFYVLFNSISVISGQWADDYERLSPMGHPFTVEKISSRAGLEFGTA